MKSKLNSNLSWMDDPDATILRVERLASISVCISCLEFLVRPQQLSDTGLLSWRVSRLRQKWLAAGVVARGLNFALSYPAVLGLICVRLLAAAALLGGRLSRPQRSALTASVAVSSIGLMLRSPYGQDGSDQMTLLTFAALTAGNLSSSNPTAKKVCLWFMGLQTCLSFITAGVAKAISPVWRNSSALVGIFGTKAYGNEKLAKYLRLHPSQTAWFSRLFFLFECLFPLVLITPKRLTRVFLAGGLIFHTLTAAIMGLNTFIWSFGATYPAIAYCNHQVTCHQLFRKVARWLRVAVEAPLGSASRS